MYLNLRLDGLRFTPEIVSLLLEIEEFKGGWKAYGNLAPERLPELQRIATIERIGSSPRIEGREAEQRGGLSNSRRAFHAILSFTR